jgi:hypothetical protein
MRVLETVRRSRALPAALALGSGFVAYGADDPNNGWGPNNRPVYAFVSVTDAFSLPSIGTVDQNLRNNAQYLGSPVVRLKMGSFAAGSTVETTRYLSDGVVHFDPNSVPPDPITGGTADFDGNQVTIVGSFKTLSPSNQIHLMTPYEGSIDSTVQTAYFNASVYFEQGLSPFANTVQTALFIYDHQRGAGATMNAILQGIFHVDADRPVLLDCPFAVCTAEGELFPHEPGDGVYGFDMDFDPDEGTLDTDICFGIDADIKPDDSTNRVQIREHGELPMAILTTDDFDAENELDPESFVAVLVGDDGELVTTVAASDYAYEDVDGDGDTDVTFKFRFDELIAGDDPVLTSSTTRIAFRGETFDGMCVQAADDVTIVTRGNSGH